MSERREKKIKPSKLCDVRSLEPYVLQDWSPEAALDSLSDISLVLSTEGLHLWNSDERTQAIAVATWVASARQEVGARLLYYGQEASHKPYVVTMDIAEHASMNLRSAQGWLDYLNRATADSDYVLTEDIKTGYPWDKLGGQVSAPLLEAVYQSARLLLFFDLEKTDNAYLNTSNLPAEFKPYLAQMSENRKLLELESEAIERLWDDDVSPNTLIGDELYLRCTTLIERIIKHGTQVLMPRIGDISYRLAEPIRVRNPVQQGNLRIFKPRPIPHLPPEPNKVTQFDPNAVKGKSESAPTPENQIPEFDPTRRSEPRSPATTNVVRGFVPRGLPEVQGEIVSDIPQFDASRLIPRFNRVPLFNPSAVTETSDSDAHIPVFDPDKLLDLTPPPLPPS